METCHFCQMTEVLQNSVFCEKCWDEYHNREILPIFEDLPDTLSAAAENTRGHWEEGRFLACGQTSITKLHSFRWINELPF